jgi:hypothetical protein
MENNNELNNMTCQIKEHSNLKIIGFCIDENCHSINKFACQECFFDNHSGHKLIKIDKLNGIIQNKLKDYKNILEEDKKRAELYDKYEKDGMSTLEKLKQKIFSEIEQKINEYKDKLKKKLQGINNNENKININMKHYEEFFVGNAAPIQRPDLTKLSEICSKIYKEKDNKNEGLNYNDYNNNKIRLLFEESSKSTADFLKAEYISINSYIKQRFLISRFVFEWCRKTYGGYDFFYELANDNTKATKKISQGTMTVLRAKEPLYDNNLYRLQFRIGLKNVGDYDVGIGTDKTGDSCWLRTKESICISNTGVINLDINMDNSIKLKDKDVINLEINTQIGKKTFKGFINKKLVCMIDFDIQDNVYVMAAMRNVGSFIELESYEVNHLNNE